MVTKEQKIEKYCCLYVNDFHLEIMLLPYIAKIENEANIIILTEYDLFNSLKEVLNRTNLAEEQKEIIRNMNWNNRKIININKEKENVVIINGTKAFIKDINMKLKDKIRRKKTKEIKVVECYNILIEKNSISTDIYDGFINTYCNIK